MLNRIFYYHKKRKPSCGRKKKTLFFFRESHLQSSTTLRIKLNNQIPIKKSLDVLLSKKANSMPYPMVEMLAVKMHNAFKFLSGVAMYINRRITYVIAARIAMTSQLILPILSFFILFSFLLSLFRTMYVKPKSKRKLSQISEKWKMTQAIAYILI